MMWFHQKLKQSVPSVLHPAGKATNYFLFLERPLSSTTTLRLRKNERFYFYQTRNFQRRLKIAFNASSIISFYKKQTKKHQVTNRAFRTKITLWLNVNFLTSLKTETLNDNQFCQSINIREWVVKTDLHCLKPS